MSGFKRVALVNVRVESRQRIPIGLLTLAACIKNRCEVKIFDPEPYEDDFSAIREFNPDLVGIGFMTQTRSRAKIINDHLRRIIPDAKFIIGGVGPTVEKEAVFEMFRPDALLFGEGEKALERMVEGEPFESIPGVYLPNIEIKPPEVYEELDDLPQLAYEIMPDFEKYLSPPGGIRGRWFNRGTPMIMTARGCPYRCTFCSSRLMFSRKVRRRSVEHVMKEIRRLHYDYGADAVYFFDDTFNTDPRWLEAFCEAILAEPYTLTWGCQVRVNLINDAQALMMRRAGCVQVDIGVESGSPKVLKAIKKDETVEQIEEAFSVCHKAGIAPMATFLVGCPEETREDVEMTKALLTRIKPSFAEFFYLIPYPGSDLYMQASMNKWIVDSSYEGRGMVDHPVMEINFTRAEQEEIRREYFRMMSFRNIKGYLSPGVVFSLLRSLRLGMVMAFLREFGKTRNLRDAMQAYVHALRYWYAQKYEREKSGRDAPPEVQSG